MGPEIKPEIEPDINPPGKIYPLTATEIIKMERLSKMYQLNESALLARLKEMEEMEKRANKPQKIRCYDCGKQIGMWQPNSRVYGYGMGLLERSNERKEKYEGLYCPDCWNLRKLKE